MRSSVSPALCSSGTDKGPKRNTSRARRMPVSSPPQRLFLCLEETTTRELKQYYKWALNSQLFLPAHFYAENRRTIAEVPLNSIKNRNSNDFLTSFFSPSVLIR